MAGTIRNRARLTRRRLLTTAASSAAITILGGIAKPYLSCASDRSRITHGVQSGDVSTDSGMVWARTDRPARMLVEVATSDSFTDIARAGGRSRKQDVDGRRKAGHAVEGDSWNIQQHRHGGRKREARLQRRSPGHPRLPCFSAP
jgi:phosphodiesterase/alkaline phosphatase D-like protein